MSKSSQASKRPYVVAMVLGTALSALGPSTSMAGPKLDATEHAVADMSRYCTTCWRNARLDPSCWGDCTQEVLVRMLERITPDTWDRVLKDEGQERREFLRAIDTVKKRSQRQRKYAPVPADGVADRNGSHERRLADDRAAVHQAATELLSARQRRILQMSFDGWSVQDIAAKLKTPAERVSDEKYKAIRKLREHLA